MTNYTQAHTMDYHSWVSREAALKNIPVSELEKKLEVKPLKTSRAGIFGSAKMHAVEDFDILAKEFDAVTDLKEGLIGQYLLGMQDFYYINGTGIKFKK